MNRWLAVTFFATLIIVADACRKAGSNHSVIPHINFIALQPDTIHLNSNEDTTFLSFDFTDGDGDLGNDPTSGNYDVFLRDSRDTSFAIMRYFFPKIPDGAVDPIDGIKGTGVIAIRALTINPRTDTLHVLHGDTATFKMWVADRAGHISDTITTSPLYIFAK